MAAPPPSWTPAQQPLKAQQQPVQQVVVYVDQNGNPIQPQQQNIPLQIMNAQNGVNPASEGSAIASGQATITNLDYLPSNYEDIINGTYDQQINPKDGMGCSEACGGHKKSWFCSIILWAYLALIIWTMLVMHLDPIEDFFSLFLGTTITAGFFWILYSLDWCGGSSMKYLTNIHGKDFVYQDVKRLHTVTPIIVWNVECYHYYTRNKKRHKKVTHTASMNYVFNTWRDLSVQLTGLEEWKLTKLTTYKTFSFANAQTENNYKMNMETFRRNNDRDRYQSFTVCMKLTDFKHKTLVEATPGQRSRCLSTDCYCLFGCLLCAVCYKTWFSSMTGKKHYIIQKEISL